MDLTKLNPLFLVFVNLRFILGLVEPPTNVTLECLNMTNIVRWSYNQPLDGVRFSVNILPYGGEELKILVDSPTLEADLSPHTTRLRIEYFITVNAMIGEKMSEDAPSDGLTFSYYQPSMVTQKCFFNLPLVNISAQPHDLVAFSFDHPALWHRQKIPRSITGKQKNVNAGVDEELPVFSYQAAVNQENGVNFNCEQRLCTGSLPVNASQEKQCVNITGNMNSVAVVPTKFNIPCVEGLKEPVEQKNYIIYIAVIVAILITVILILFFLFRKKTLPDSKTPNSVLSIKPSNNQARTFETENTDQIHAVEPSSPTPLLTNEEKNEFTPEPKLNSEYEVRLAIGVSMEPEDELKGDLEEGLAAGEDPGYSNRGLEDGYQGSDTSGYEKRPVVVELESGETVSGYH